MKQKPASRESLFGRGWLFAPIIIFAGIFPLTAQEQENPFRDLLNTETYQKRLEELRPRFAELEEEAASGLPAIGLEVVDIVDGGQADRAGVSEGDILMALDDQRLWGVVPMIRKDEMQIVTFHRLGEGTETFEVTPDKLGTSTLSFYRPEMAYLQNSAKRNDQWDLEVTMGIALRDENPILAETAWHYAMEKGYPEDVYSRYFKTLFAFNRQKVTQTELREFVESVSSLKEEAEGFLLPGLGSFLGATRSPDLMEALLSANGATMPWTGEELEILSQWDRGNPEPDGAALLARAKTLHGKNITRSIQSTLKKHQEKPYRPFAFPPGYTHKVSAGRYRLMEGAPPESQGKLKNVHVHAVVTTRALGRHSHWMNAFRVAVVDNGKGPFERSQRYKDTGIKASARLIYASVNCSKRTPVPYLNVGGGTEPRWLIRDLPLEFPEVPGEQKAEEQAEYDPLAGLNQLKVQPAKAFSFDLIRLNGEVAFYINDFCYVHYPCDPEIDDVKVHMHICGLEMKFDEFNIWRLKDE